ncbi:MAG: 2-dehydropantoate 2-reductase [Rhodospirillaceae bacterium]|nr:2-dehydropantoate 2-reductase [Rhodospirillaceae bacterium]
MGKKIAIVGAGAVGSKVGGHMLANGEDVTFIDGWPDHVEKINKDGLYMTGNTPEEEMTVQGRALHLTDVQELAKEDPIDIAFVSMKSYDTEWATQLIKPYLAPDGFIVSLQNCMNEEFIAAIVGWGKVMGTIAAKISVQMPGPGHVHRNGPIMGNSHTVFRVGEPHGRITPRAEEVAQLCGYCDSYLVTTNLWGERWTKLVMNSSSNPMAAASGLSSTAISEDADLRKVKIHLAAEAIEVGRAAGFNLEKLHGIDCGQWTKALDGDKAAYAEIEEDYIEMGKKGNPDGRPSMGQDMQKGRRTEIDFMNGLVCMKAREFGLKTPVNDGIVEAAKMVEKDPSKATPDLVKGLLP